MGFFAEVDEFSNIIKVVQSKTLTKAKTLLPGFENTSIINVTASKKCDNFYQLARVYDRDSDCLLPAKVFPSWVVDALYIDWKPPIEQPHGSAVWDEESKSWV
jgi:hypothetical protein